MTVQEFKDKISLEFPWMKVYGEPGSIRIEPDEPNKGCHIYYDPSDGYLVINTVAGAFDIPDVEAMSVHLSDLACVASFIKEIERRETEDDI